MECNRTLASHRLALSSSFSLVATRRAASRLVSSRFAPSRALRRIRADFSSLCPRALFLLQEIRARSRDRAPAEVFRRYFKRAAPHLLPPHLYFCPRFYFYMSSYLRPVSWGVPQKSPNVAHKSTRSRFVFICRLFPSKFVYTVHFPRVVTTVIKCATDVLRMATLSSEWLPCSALLQN